MVRGRRAELLQRYKSFVLRGYHGLQWRWTGDFDNDGDVDIFASSMYGNRAHLLINDGTGIFKDEATLRGADMFNGNPHYGTSSTVFDYNNDGWLTSTPGVATVRVGTI